MVASAHIIGMMLFTSILRDIVGTQELDVLIIGAGPAGLAGAAAAQGLDQQFCIVEEGPDLPERDRDDPLTLTRGVGGAGLYSDGKFSFYPSATGLWRLEDQATLREAYSWCSTLLQAHGLGVPAFPATLDFRDAKDKQIVQKCYPSQYMSLSSRIALIEELSVAPPDTVLTGARVRHCEFTGDSWECSVLDNCNSLRQYRCRAVIFAAGRFGPLVFPQLLPYVPMDFRHFELGIRIEQPSNRFFLSKAAELDPKLLVAIAGDNDSMRTFCCCRDGEVVVTNTQGIWSVSGRADGPKTGRSNVGFNVRLHEKQSGEANWNNLLPKISVPPLVPLSENLKVFQDSASRNGGASRIAELFGPAITGIIARGIGVLQSQFDTLRDPETQLWAPTIEGVGRYPRVNSDLRVDNLPLWIAGDSSGMFRGLTAALISGYYAGRRASVVGGS